MEILFQNFKKKKFQIWDENFHSKKFEISNFLFFRDENFCRLFFFFGKNWFETKISIQFWKKKEYFWYKILILEMELSIPNLRWNQNSIPKLLWHMFLWWNFFHPKHKLGWNFYIFEMEFFIPTLPPLFLGSATSFKISQHEMQ